MAPLREVRSLLMPLLARQEDLAVVGRQLIVTPVRHHIRAVLLDRTSTANCFRPRWYVHHLFSPGLQPHISWGQIISGAKGFVWDARNINTQKELNEKIVSVALPILRRIETLDDFISVIQERWQGHHLINDDWTRIAVALAMGDIEQARACCTDRICNMPDPGPKEAPSWKATVAGDKELCKLLRAGDVAGAIAKLHEWERQTVKNLKIEHLWQPTPFPIEEKLGLTAAH